MNTSWLRMRILVQQTLPGTRNCSQWTSDLSLDMSAAILGCFPSFKYSPIWLDPCCYFCKLSLGLGCFDMLEINCFMKEWSKRRLKGDERTFGASLIPDLFPWLYKNECVWKPAPFKENLQLINWFIILNSFYWMLCKFVMLAGGLSGEQTSCSILCMCFDKLIWYQNDSGLFTF